MGKEPEIKNLHEIDNHRMIECKTMLYAFLVNVEGQQGKRARKQPSRDIYLQYAIDSASLN